MNKRILLTGGTGYLGSELAKRLVERNTTLYLVCRKASKLERLEGIASYINFVDIESGDVECLIRGMAPLDMVIHTATNYDRCSDSDEKLISANYLFPQSVLSGAIKSGVPIFINTDTILNRRVNRYSMTKKQFLDWGRYYSNKSDIKFINIVLHNIYGPKAASNNFISSVTRTFLAGQEKMDFSHGYQKRDFVFISDVLDGFMSIIDAIGNLSSNFKEYEIGVGKPISIRELVDIIYRKSCAKTFCNFGAIEVNGLEKMEYCADISEIKKIGWEPRVNLEAGIDMVFSYERDLFNRND